MALPSFVLAPIAALLSGFGALPKYEPGIRMHEGTNMDLVASVGRAMLGQNGQNPYPALHSSMQLTGLLYESAADGLVATPGGGAAGALQLSAEVNRLTTVASAGDSAALPPAYPGLTIVVVNHGARAAALYGCQQGAVQLNGVPQPDTINDVGGVSQMPGSEVIFVCITPGKWYASGLGVGYLGSLQTQSFAGGLVARAGGGQANATPIAAMVSKFGTVATAGDSALLPATVPAISIGPLTVINGGAQAMAIFPAGTDTVGAGGPGAAYALPAGKVANLYSADQGAWHVVLGS